MKTSIRAALTILALPIFWTNPSRAAGPSSKAVAHRVTLAPVDGYVFEAEPNDPPSSTHPEGTVFALVHTDATATANVVELDANTGAELHRAPLMCAKILREKNSLFAICDDEVVEMDRTLSPVTRYATRRCAAGTERKDIKLVTDHGSRVVALYTCDGKLQLTIVDTTEHRVRSNVSTNLLPYGYRYAEEQTQIFFHGANIVGVVPGMPLGPYEIFALSPDQRRVSRTLVVDGQGFGDDGSHLHLYRASEKAGQDTTLSDQLTPLSTRPLLPRAEERRPPLPQGLGGDGIRYTFTQGDVTFYMTFTCCGSGSKAGLYAAVATTAQ